MGSCCAVGARQDAAEIDAALKAGGPDNSFRKLAARFGVSVAALQRHKPHAAGACQEADTGGDTRTGSEVAAIHKSAESLDDTRTDTPDTVGSGGRLAACDDARAREDAEAWVAKAVDVAPPQPVEDVRAHDERVLHIADLMAAGEYHGRKTARELGARWGVARGTVQNYARAAALVCHADHGEIEQHRQESLGRWLRLYEEALLGGDVKAAVTAQAGYDRAAGVVQPGGAKVQVNVLQGPGFGEAVALIGRTVLVLCPERAEDFAAWLEAAGAEDALAKADPAAWLARHRSTITVEAG